MRTPFGSGRNASRRFGQLVALPEHPAPAPEPAPTAGNFATLYRGNRTTRCVIVAENPTHAEPFAVLDLVSEGEVIGRQQNVPLFDSLDDPRLEARLIQCPASPYAIREV